MNSRFNNRVLAGAALVAITFVMAIGACGQSDNGSRARAGDASEVNIPESLSWSERMAQSIIKRNPEAWMTDFRETPRWSYTHGVIMSSMLSLWEKTGRKEYYDYAKSYADVMIDDNGDIKGYDIDEFNIDHINAGKTLFKLYEKSGDERYLKTIKTLRTQLEWQPRIREGGYWHKLRYPWQMWLDGLYMGAPFYAQYASEMDEPSSFDDIALQFYLIEKNCQQEGTGLLYHGYDESRVQKWSDPLTGCSPNIWGRAMGWYGMALVDVLEFFPEDHKERESLIRYLNEFAEAIGAVQDSETGLWYQVLDQGGREGNYLEATASSMFVYAIAKGVNNGWLDEKYMDLAKSGFDGIIKTLIKVDDSGEVHLTKCCSVAGLGGSPYRDGSYEYYIGESVRDNDPKGTGPFIMAVLELEKFDKYARH